MKLRRVIHSFKNGSRVDNRSMRRCRQCGGVQYDWGVNFYITKRGRTQWYIYWYCAGRGSCGAGQTEYMSEKAIGRLRTNPARIKPAPSAPWKRRKAA